MQIEALEIVNYRLFRDARFNGLPRMAVVVGANGSGKTTLFDVFSFLKEALTQNVATAVARRGGFRELVSRGESGPIAITVKFRESGGRLATYQLEIADDTGRPVVHREVLKFRRGQFGQPWHFVDFSRGRGVVITNEAAYGQEGVEAERKEHVLDDPSVLAIKGLGQFKEFRVVAEFRSLIENCTSRISISAMPGQARKPVMPNICQTVATTSHRWRSTCMKTTASSSTACCAS